MDFSTIKTIVIPEGNVTQIAQSTGAVLWRKQSAAEYTFIESIDVPSRGTLDTGIACSSGDYLYVDFAPLAATQYGAVVHAGSSKIMRVYIDGANIQAKIDWYNQTIATAVAGTRLNITFAAQVVYLNGTKKVDMSGVSAFTADTDVILGGVGAALRIYGCKHGSSAEALDMDLVPAIRNSDSVAGLYDSISKTFQPFGAATA